VSEQSNKPTILHTQVSQKKRRAGHRMSQAERELAQKQFIESFKLNANITVACSHADISRDTFYQWLEHDQSFSILYNQASEQANDVLLAAAWRRGVQGYEKPVVSMGKQVYVEEELPDGRKIRKPLMERVYSDTVLLRLMSYRIPGFKEATSSTTINNMNVQVERNQVYANMREDELDQLENLWNNAQERLQRGGS
jgi:hypothetical protein